jgi:prepilin-type processing-associated H-X9-DG protein/prepilin-type N-terminal cleavage/methylation domain-containing protein
MKSSRDRAFTMIELLAAVAIVGVLAALVFPALGKLRATSDSGKCVSNLRQISAGFQSYAQENDGLYPAPRGGTWGDPARNPTGYTLQVEIAPYTTAPLAANNVWALKNVAPSKNAQYCPSYLRLYPSYIAVRDNGIDALGYGMNLNLNVAGKDINFGDRINLRFKAINITKPATSILIGDSSNARLDVTDNWKKTAPSSSLPEGYTWGAPTRHGGKGNYLFADGHVEALTTEQARTQLAFTQ